MRGGEGSLWGGLGWPESGVEACILYEGFGKRLWMGEVGEMGILCDYFQKRSLNTFLRSQASSCVIGGRNLAGVG